MQKVFRFTTSTATFCAFDPKSLEHRLNDPPDWWSDYFEEIQEVNSGNIMIVGLGGDGTYDVLFTDDPSGSGKSVSARIRCDSGILFFGPGEDITSGGLEPMSRNTTGIFLDYPPGTYEIVVKKISDVEISVSVHKVEGEANNDCSEQLLLEF